jgi:hypothetical protein
MRAVELGGPKHAGGRRGWALTRVSVFHPVLRTAAARHLRRQWGLQPLLQEFVSIVFASPRVGAELQERRKCRLVTTDEAHAVF